MAALDFDVMSARADLMDYDYNHQVLAPGERVVIYRWLDLELDDITWAQTASLHNLHTILEVEEVAEVESEQLYRLGGKDLEFYSRVQQLLWRRKELLALPPWFTSGMRAERLLDPIVRQVDPFWPKKLRERMSGSKTTVEWNGGEPWLLSDYQDYPRGLVRP